MQKHKEHMDLMQWISNYIDPDSNSKVRSYYTHSRKTSLAAYIWANHLQDSTSDL